MKRLTSLLILFVLVPCITRAGGWTQKKGGYYAKFSLNNFSTREQFNLAKMFLSSIRISPAFRKFGKS